MTMKREIKFRGKTESSNEWVFGDLIQENSGRNKISTNLSTWGLNKDDVDPYGEEFVVIDETIGQYTGLHDINKIDIYEDDLIRSLKTDTLMKIVYDNEEASFMAICINGDTGTDFELRRHITQKWIDENPKKVIGNIFDNQKLLEK